MVSNSNKTDGALENPHHALIVGGGAIASAVAQQWLKHHTLGTLHLVTRNANHWRQQHPWSTQYPQLQLIKANVLNDDDLKRLISSLNAPSDSPPLHYQTTLRFVFIGTGLLHGHGHGQKEGHAQHSTQQPERQLSALNSDWMLESFKVNTLLPARVISQLAAIVPKQGPFLIAALSARVGSIGDNRLGGWYSYRATKAALNQFIHTAAIELHRKNPNTICVSLHPGTVDSALSQPFQNRVPSQQLFSPEHSATCLWQVLTTLEPQHSGGFFAWDGQAIDW
jgi:NAD(P)-dependent dehydrogenase (short-subunit alcohol dehydrogenase family)